MKTRRRNFFWFLAAMLVGGAGLAGSLNTGNFHEATHVSGIVAACVIIIWGILRLAPWNNRN
ncbi:MAG: hypothetical protein EOP84_04050 [Verrucomicrobiaceae bacterium]|nr:MAG: hypothetical protein EOP84_04050 [Verrucomicrobiaceae bacterium]